MLFEVISPSTPGHSLLILTDLLTTLLSQFNNQVIFIDSFDV